MIIDSSDSDSETEPPLSIRLYSTKPRNSVQRRATITGASPTTKHGIDIEQFWKELKQEHNTSSQLRDKAASCAHGLDNVPSTIRSQTCINIEQSKRKKKNDGQNDDKKIQFQDKSMKHDVSQGNTINLIHEKKDTCKSIQEELCSNINISRQISQMPVNVTNNNNLSDTNVPLDECNNFIRDKHSNSKNTLSNKEVNINNGKERGKLDKSYSTPAYDSMDVDNIEDRKQKLFYALELSTNNVSNELNKTDVQLSSENFEDQQKLEDIDQKQSIQINFDNNIQKNSNIDKYIMQDNEEKECSEKLSEYSIPIYKIITNHEISKENNQSNNDYINTEVNKYDKKNITKNLTVEAGNMSVIYNTEIFANNSSLSHKSEDKVESINSFMENNNQNSNSNLNKFGKIHQMFNGSNHCASIDMKLMERKSNTLLKKNIQAREQICTNNDLSTTEDNTKIYNNITQNIPHIHFCQKIQNDNVKGENLIIQENAIQSCIEVKSECNKKLETRSHLIPPDPPPRKYYSKLAVDTSITNTSKICENYEKYISENFNTKKDLRSAEYFMENHIKNNLLDQDRQNYFDCNNFTEKLEFIDDTSDNELKTNLDSTYLEYNDKQGKETKFICDKYEPTIEKSIYTNSTMEYYNNTECYSQNMDSPDGSCSSKQFLDHKSKVFEKEKSFEKGVVNKAMMVARSIGLHGSLNKSSSNSPRSNRKRSILFASN